MLTNVNANLASDIRHQQQKPLLFLLGPTAAGKTALAVECVKQWPCEIISVDSVMVYRGMNIGAAKPDAATLKIAPHHLIDIIDPADIYSAGRFRQDAQSAITAIHARNKIPILVGGTMLYFRVLQSGLATLPPRDAQLRAELIACAEQQGWESLHAQLAKIDADAAARIHINDGHRIIRALEVHRLTGQAITLQQQTNTMANHNYFIQQLIVTPNSRANLHARIAQRFDAMLEAGFVDEVNHLYERGDLNLSLPSIRSAGYAQVWAHLAGNLTFDQMREQGIAATRQLAKRQMTWLKGQYFKDAVWVMSEQVEQGLTKAQLPDELRRIMALFG